MNIVFKNKVKRVVFFFVSDPKHKDASLLRAICLWLKVLGSKRTKIKENESTLKKYMNILFKNKVIRVDFFSFFKPKMKILVFQDQINHDLLFLGLERKN